VSSVYCGLFIYFALRIKLGEIFMYNFRKGCFCHLLSSSSHELVLIPPQVRVSWQFVGVRFCSFFHLVSSAGVYLISI